jgi:hypothetical protein
VQEARQYALKALLQTKALQNTTRYAAYENRSEAQTPRNMQQQEQEYQRQARPNA